MARARQDQDFAKAFGEVLRILRKERGLSQEKLAAEVGMSYSTVRQWEMGREAKGGGSQHVLPNLHNLRYLCKALDVEMWRLFRAVQWKLDARDAERKMAESADEVFRVREVERIQP